MAWLSTISRAQATGALADAYAAMDNRPMPPVYRAPHGEPARRSNVHRVP